MMQGHSKGFEETIKAGRFIGPLTKPDQDMFDLLTSFTDRVRKPRETSDGE